MDRYERVRANDSGMVAALSGCGLLCAVASGFALSTTSADAIKSFAWSVATSAPAAANQLPTTMYAGVRALATESADKMGVPVTFADAACGASAFCSACESSSAQTATALCVAMAVSALAALSFVRPGFSGRANLSVLANAAAALALAFAMYSFHQGCAQTMPEESTRLGSGFHLALIAFICHTAAAVVQASDRQEFEAEELTDVFCQAPYNTSRKFAPTCPQVASGQLRAPAYGQPRSYLPPPMYAETQMGFDDGDVMGFDDDEDDGFLLDNDDVSIDMLQYDPDEWKRQAKRYTDEELDALEDDPSLPITDAEVEGAVVSSQPYLNMSAIKEAREKWRLSDNDTGSPEYQIATLSMKIAYLTEHLRKHKNDFSTRRGLLAMVNGRRKMLNYLFSQRPDKALEIAEALSIRWRPPQRVLPREVKYAVYNKKAAATYKKQGAKTQGALKRLNEAYVSTL